jgi:hypothetical protein
VVKFIPATSSSRTLPTRAAGGVPAALLFVRVYAYLQRRSTATNRQKIEMFYLVTQAPSDLPTCHWICHWIYLHVIGSHAWFGFNPVTTVNQNRFVLLLERKLIVKTAKTNHQNRPPRPIATKKEITIPFHPFIQECDILRSKDILGRTPH